MKKWEYWEKMVPKIIQQPPQFPIQLQYCYVQESFSKSSRAKFSSFTSMKGATRGAPSGRTDLSWVHTQSIALAEVNRSFAFRASIFSPQAFNSLCDLRDSWPTAQLLWLCSVNTYWKSGQFEAFYFQMSTAAIFVLEQNTNEATGNITSLKGGSLIS